MSVVSGNNFSLKRTYLEIDFSESVFNAASYIISFAGRHEINYFIVYLRENNISSAERLADFCMQAQQQGISCRAAAEWDQHEIIRLLKGKNISLQIRICTDNDLDSFISEKDEFSNVCAELYYDRQRQDNWNIAEALDRCQINNINCSFGCSDSYISATEDELAKICGNDLTVPFPRSYNCLRFAESLFIAKDGTVLPCRGLKKLPIGNIFSESFDEIFENSTILDHYSNYYSKLKKPCKDCSRFNTCAGCRGRAYQYSSDFLSADPACPHNSARIAEITRLPVKDPENYMPHQKPMLMISELLSISDNICETLSIIQPDNPFLQADGKLHPSALIEIGAQSMAFLDTFLHPDSKIQGMLVEVKNFEYSGLPIYPQTRLLICGRKIYEMPPWNIGSFNICAENNEFIAAGEVKVCQL